MTLEIRTQRLVETFRFTPRQARFLTLTALMGGYCLRRQYGMFAGQHRTSLPIRHLFARLLTERLALAYRPALHRGYVYHLYASRLYDALSLADNRHRRRVGTAKMARRLMTLDFALTQPERRWYATETDKLTLFVKNLRLSDAVLPHRVYRGTNGDTTTRYFIQKLPIFQPIDSDRIYFTVLALDTSGQAVRTFLEEHHALLAALSSWTLIPITAPPFARGLPLSEAAFRAHTRAAGAPLTSALARLLHEHFLVEHALRTPAGPAPSTTQLEQYRARRPQLEAHGHHRLYGAWVARGGPARPLSAAPDLAAPIDDITYEPAVLPFSYDLFGRFPGVA